MQSNGLSQRYTRGQALPELLKQRILILDGAMGTMIQQYKLTEADYRGLPGNTRFADHPGDIVHSKPPVFCLITTKKP